MDLALQHLPTLAGIVWGVLGYARGVSISGPLCVFAVGFVLGRLGSGLVRSRPMLALVLIEASSITVWAVTALMTMLTISVSLWITENAPLMFGGSPDQQKTLAGILVGGIASYFGALWTMGDKSGERSLAPSRLFRSALKKQFARPPSPATDSLKFDAAFNWRVRQDGAQDAFEGWGFNARWKRVHILTN